MADIIPIRPWRYNRRLSASMDALTSPPFDAVSERQRSVLYQQPYNSIHLSVPPDSAGRAAERLQEWKRDAVLTQDEIPGIYVYCQYFSLPGSSRQYCRRGFICHIYTHPWDEKVVLRHERVTPGEVKRRLELLEKTELHASPTLGLYSDKDFQLERFMDAAIADPLYEWEDYQGVRNVLAVIHDARVINTFMDVLRDKQVMLADGHDRYEASLIYREKQRSIHPGHIRKAGYNFHLMCLTNTEASDLKILPAHRVLKGLSGFNVAEFIKQLQEDFIVKSIDDADTLPEALAGKRWAFGILLKDKALKILLKPEAFPTLKGSFPDEIKKLDLTIMDYFIIEKILGIRSEERSEHVTVSRSFPDCMRQVSGDDSQMTIITNAMTIEDVKSICHSDYTMPQKSVYFYPTVISGFLFTSINEIEFALPFYAPF